MCESVRPHSSDPVSSDKADIWLSKSPSNLDPETVNHHLSPMLIGKS